MRESCFNNLRRGKVFFKCDTCIRVSRETQSLGDAQMYPIQILRIHTYNYLCNVCGHVSGGERLGGSMHM